MFYLIKHNLPPPQKRKLPKVRVGAEFCFVFPGESKFPTKNLKTIRKIRNLQKKCKSSTEIFPRKRVIWLNGIAHFQQKNIHKSSQMFASTLYRHIWHTVFLQSQPNKNLRLGLELEYDSLLFKPKNACFFSEIYQIWYLKYFKNMNLFMKVRHICTWQYLLQRKMTGIEETLWYLL